MNIRMPFWYRQQLEDEAETMHMPVNALILDALERVYKPHEPKD